MTAPDPVVPENADDAATAPAEQPTEQPKVTDTVDYWKQRARENEARAKANADAAKELSAIKDRDLSELQRAQKQATETAAQLAELQRQNVLLSKGITADLTPPAHTASPDDWAAYADRLLAWKGTQAPAAPVVTNPKPDLSQGARPADDAQAEMAAYEAIKAQNWAFMTTPTRK